MLILEVESLVSSFRVLLRHLGLLWLSQFFDDIELILELQVIHPFIHNYWVELAHWANIFVVVSCATLQYVRLFRAKMAFSLFIVKTLGIYSYASVRLLFSLCVRCLRSMLP